MGMHRFSVNPRAPPSRRSSKSFKRTTSQYPSTLHSTALSKTTSKGNNAAISSEELDCFRSMRGTSIPSANSLESAMSSDLNELDDRLDSIRRAGEREKKVFDKQGQAYSILVTHDEVRVCHMDEKGEYHYRHLPNAVGASVSSTNSRRTSDSDSDKRPLGLKRDLRTTLGISTNNNSKKNQKPQPRRQIVLDTAGRTLVDIAPDTITVYHRSGVWRCHRFAGKIWDSDYATHVTAKMPRPWEKLRRRHRAAAAELDADSNKENATEPQVGEELLLCSNTPGERGSPPKAYKSFYHNL